MTSTPSDGEQFSRLNELTTEERKIADPCLSDLMFRARLFGVPLALDARAEAFEAALVAYIVASRAEHG